MPLASSGQELGIGQILRTNNYPDPNSNGADDEKCCPKQMIECTGPKGTEQKPGKYAAVRFTESILQPSVEKQAFSENSHFHNHSAICHFTHFSPCFFLEKWLGMKDNPRSIMSSRYFTGENKSKQLPELSFPVPSTASSHTAKFIIQKHCVLILVPCSNTSGNQVQSAQRSVFLKLPRKALSMSISFQPYFSRLCPPPKTSHLYSAMLPSRDTFLLPFCLLSLPQSYFSSKTLLKFHLPQTPLCCASVISVYFFTQLLLLIITY